MMLVGGFTEQVNDGSGFSDPLVCKKLKLFSSCSTALFLMRHVRRRRKDDISAVAKL